MTKNDTVEIVRVCAEVWNAIRKRHPDVPEVAIVLASGLDGKKLNYGHFHTHSWVKGESTMHELLIGGEGLGRGAVEVLGTLLHEAAHGMATTREIKDTSRQGRFHNARFKALAEELGLELVHDSGIGWSVTAVPEATRKVYAREVRRLEGVLSVYRRILPRSPMANKPNNRLVMECACPRKFQIYRSIADLGPIYCGVCDGEFTVPEGEEETEA